MKKKLQWDNVGERLFETGVDHGVLYPMANDGTYPAGYSWNGLTGVNENPSGAESNPIWADNQKYVNLISAEDFGATIECLMTPPEFDQCDGLGEIVPGIVASQQNRRNFGLSYRSLVGNDVKGQDYGYKLHLVYGATASPSEKSRQTVNDNPDAMSLSYSITTTPVDVPGFKPTAHLTIDSTKTNAAKLAALEAILYGSDPVAAKEAVYKETEDSSPDSGKTYYTKSGTTYSEFSGSTFSSSTTYYELVTPAVAASEGTTARLPLPAEIIELMKDSEISG